MYKNLPNYLQKQIEKYLMSDDFRKAKALHDSWVAENEAVERRRTH